MIVDLKNIKTYYITLQQDPASAEIHQVLTQLGYKNINPRPGYIDRRSKPHGISMAAYNILKEHLSNETFEPFIIFEEDARPIADKDFINIPDNADALYLGFIYGGNITNPQITKTDFDGVYRIVDPLGAHAIAFLSESYAKKAKSIVSQIVTDIFPIMHVDGGYGFLSRDNNVYIVDPLFSQENSGNPFISSLTKLRDLSLVCE